jgi:hypothetical protein
MCGRFTQNYTWQEVHEFLSVFGAARNLRPRYNFAPTTSVDVVRLDGEARRELVLNVWRRRYFMNESGGHGSPDSIIGWRGSPLGRPCSMRQTSTCPRIENAALRRAGSFKTV